jgi:phosphonate transport system substrate-binding protein
MKKAAVSAAGVVGLTAALACASSIAIGSAAAASNAVCPSGTINFAIEPYDTGPALEKAYKSLATDLGQKLGCQINLIISNSYVAEIDSMAAGHIQMGEFGPLGYVLANKLADAQPVAAFGDKNGKPDVYSAGIWVKKSSPITSLKQLTGKTLALSDTTSTSGGLYPLSALVKSGFKCSISQASGGNCGGVKIKWTGGHPQDLLALTNGTVDAAEINSQEQFSATAAHQFNASGYRQIWKSTDIINDPIAVSGKLGASFANKIKSALLSLSAKQTSTVDTELGTKNNGPMVAASNALYNNVRSVANALNLKTGNL